MRKSLCEYNEKDDKARVRHCVRSCEREKLRDPFVCKGRETLLACVRGREIAGVYYFQSMSLQADANCKETRGEGPDQDNKHLISQTFNVILRVIQVDF